MPQATMQFMSEDMVDERGRYLLITSTEELGEHEKIDVLADVIRMRKTSFSIEWVREHIRVEWAVLQQT